jgi:hypothetical protein
MPAGNAACSVQRLRESLREDIEGNSRPLAYMLPTTRAVVSAVDTTLREQSGGAIVVGSAIPGASSPAQLLARVRSGAHDGPRLVLIFTDQLLAPELATIPVESNGVKSLVSGLEPVLHARYGFALRALLGSNIETTNAPGTVDGAIALIDRYFEACAGLGDDWLMRDRQVEREQAFRVRDTKLRLRYLQSAVFYAFRDTPLDEVGVSALKRVEQAIQQLSGRGY